MEDFMGVLPAVRRKAVPVGAVSMLLWVLTGLTASPAFAEPSHCTGTQVFGTYDDLVVPSGATCELLGVVVQGNVGVEPGGTLLVERAPSRGVSWDTT
jgi:hypothetical protein